jgi:aminomethyltransferase
MSDSEAIKTAFHAVTEAKGGTHIADGGWWWLEGFGDLGKEYAAIRDDVAVWDVSPLNKWDFRGRDALRGAQTIHAGNIAGLADGQVRYGPFCDGDGLVVDDGTVYRFSQDHLWVMTNSASHDEHFAEALAGLDVRVEHIGRQLPHLGLIGPRAREALAPICDADLTSLRYFHFLTDPVKVGGVPCWLSRTGFGGELGYELFVAPEHAQDLWQVVVSETGARPFGVEAIEMLRIESGLVITDYDYEAHLVTPFDLGMERLVHLDGPDFLGKAALEKVASNPPHRLKTLRVEGDTLPAYGAEVTREGRPVGTLTSPTDSPGFGKIGLAILDAEVAGSRTIRDANNRFFRNINGRMPAVDFFEHQRPFREPKPLSD